MTSDMGGLYKIAQAMQSKPEELELLTQRLELDRRALAIRYAQDTIKFDLRTDKNAELPPEYVRVLEAARVYYAFLADGPSVQDDLRVQP